ncbi:MAG: cupredoxin domain-containing protein [archaeon]
MKNTTLLIIVAAIIILIGGYSLFANSGNNSPSNPSTSSSGEVQKLVLSYKNYNYYPNTITVKANQPVRISLDSSVAGCYRTFTLKDFGVYKYLKTPSDYVEFTPTKTGTFTFACGMGMGFGKIVVQ